MQPSGVVRHAECDLIEYFNNLMYQAVCECNEMRWGVTKQGDPTRFNERKIKLQTHAAPTGQTNTGLKCQTHAWITLTRCCLREAQADDTQHSSRGSLSVCLQLIVRRTGGRQGEVMCQSSSDRANQTRGRELEEEEREMRWRTGNR